MLETMTDSGGTTKRTPKEAFCELDIVEKYRRERGHSRSSRASELSRKVRDVAARNAEIEKLYPGKGDEPKKLYENGRAFTPKEELKKLYENARLASRRNESVEQPKEDVKKLYENARLASQRNESVERPKEDVKKLYENTRLASHESVERPNEDFKKLYENSRLASQTNKNVERPKEDVTKLYENTRLASQRNESVERHNEDFKKLYENTRLASQSSSARNEEPRKSSPERHKSRSLSRKQAGDTKVEKGAVELKGKRSSTLGRKTHKADEEKQSKGTADRKANRLTADDEKAPLQTISSATVCENCSGHIGVNRVKARHRRRESKREAAGVSAAAAKQVITVFENKNVVEQTDSMKECGKEADKNEKGTHEVAVGIPTRSPPRIVEESYAKRHLLRMRRRLAKTARNVEARSGGVGVKVDRKELGFSQLNLVPDVGQYEGLKRPKCVTTQTSKNEVAVVVDDDVFDDEIRPKELSQTTLALRDIFKVCELEKVNSFRNKSNAPQPSAGMIPERELRNFQRQAKGGNIVRNAKFHTSKTVMPNERVVEIASRTFRNQKVSFTVEGVEPAKRLHMHFDRCRLPPQSTFTLEKQVFPGIEINCSDVVTAMNCLPEAAVAERREQVVSSFKAGMRRKRTARYRSRRWRKVHRERNALVETSTQTLVQGANKLEPDRRRRNCVDSDTQTDNRADIAVEANLIETTNSSASDDKSKEQNRRFFDYVMSVFHANVGCRSDLDLAGSQKKLRQRRRKKCEPAPSLPEQKSKSCGHLERLLQNFKGRLSQRSVCYENSEIGESLRSDGARSKGDVRLDRKSADCLQREIVVLEKCLRAILSRLNDKGEDSNVKKKRRPKHCTYRHRKPSRLICTISTATGARISLYRQNVPKSVLKSKSRLKSVYRNDRGFISSSTSEATVSKSTPSLRLAFCNVLQNSYVPAKSSSRSWSSSRQTLAGIRRERKTTRQYAKDLRRLVQSRSRVERLGNDSLGRVVVLSVSSTCTFYTSSSNRVGGIQRRLIVEDVVVRNDVVPKSEVFRTLRKEKAVGPFYIKQPGQLGRSKTSVDSLETNTACPLSAVFNRSATSCAYQVYNTEIAERSAEIVPDADSGKVKTLTTFAKVYNTAATFKDESRESEAPEPVRTDSCQSLYVRYAARHSAEQCEPPPAEPPVSSTCVLSDSRSTVPPNESGYDTSKSAGIRGFFSRNSSLLDVFKPKVNKEKWFKFVRPKKGADKTDRKHANLTSATFQSDSYTGLSQNEEPVRSTLGDENRKYSELEKKLDFLLAMRLSGKGHEAEDT